MYFKLEEEGGEAVSGVSGRREILLFSARLKAEAHLRKELVEDAPVDGEKRGERRLRARRCRCCAETKKRSVRLAPRQHFKEERMLRERR